MNSSAKKTLTILGSTGSVGVNTLRVVREHAAHFQVAGLAAGSNTTLLKDQIEFFKPSAVYLKESGVAAAFQKSYGSRLKVFTEEGGGASNGHAASGDGLAEFTSFVNADILVAASAGSTSLTSVLDALKNGKRVALANKEILVIAGGLVMEALKKSPKASLLPVDSEHSAIFQCLQGSGEVEKLILTGSGGPLKDLSRERFANISKEVVINHPKWKMGKKISVDSATLMNKGLEMIEASWIFNMPIEKIEVLIHPEAVIHSMVEFRDGSVLAQLGVTDMRLPIQYALSYPERLDVVSELKLDFRSLKELTFDQPDRAKFPCLDIALHAAKRSGSAPCVLSAADEIAVGAYLDDRIDFLQIPTIIEKVLSSHRHVAKPNLKEIRSIHDWAAEETRRLCQTR